DRRPLPNVFNGLRTLSFSVDKRTKPNPFTIIRLRTLSQNMGGGGGALSAAAKVILKLHKFFRMRSYKNQWEGAPFPSLGFSISSFDFRISSCEPGGLIRGAGGGKALFGGIVVEVQKLRGAFQQIRRHVARLVVHPTRRIPQRNLLAGAFQVHRP